MRTKRLAAFTILLATALAGCVSSPKATKYYKEATFSPPLDQEASFAASGPITATAFSLDTPATPTKPKHVFDLADHGQRAFIEAVAAHTDAKATSTEVAKAVGAPIPSPKKQTALLDLTRSKRRLVISIDNQLMQPADRLHRSDITISLNDDAEFLGWDKIATQYDTVDLGKLTFAQQNKFTLGAALETPGIKELTSASAGAELSRSLQEEVQLAQRYRAISGALTKTKARIVRQGVVGIDLTGNVVVDLIIALTDVNTTKRIAISGYKNKDGTPRDGDELKPSFQDVMFPTSAANPITATVRLDYVLRTVSAGQETIVEADDKVEYRRRWTAVGQTTETDSPAQVVLIPVERLRVVHWEIRHSDDRVLMLRDATKQQAMHFKTQREAQELVDWIVATKGAHGIREWSFILEDDPLLPTDIPELNVHPVPNWKNPS